MVVFTHDDVLTALEEAPVRLHGAAAGPYARAVVDSRRVGPGDLFVALRGARVDGNDFVPDAFARGAAAALAERAPAAMPAGRAVYVVPDALAALQRLAGWFWARRPLPALAITGTVGKTSTKEVAARVFGTRYRVLATEGGLNGEIGLPLVLLRREPQHAFAVLELGMYRRGEIALQCRLAPPRYGIVTNIGYTHMERLGSREAIVAAKRELVEHIPPDGVAALNGDDPLVLSMRGACAGRVIVYGTVEGCDVHARDLASHGRAGIAFTLGHAGRSARVRSPLVGLHHVSTCLAVAAVALADGFTLAEVAEALAHADNPLRLRFLAGPRGALLIDDTYNANPASMTAALRVLAEQPGRRLAVLGDMLELGAVEEEAHRALGREAAAVAEVLFTVGPRARWIAEAARAAGAADVRAFAGKDGLTEALAAELRAGDVVLLKGSRGLALETVVEALSARAGD
jgi:UDP-N-acetylmuramoyl-tripeptide--D-alanyl-D-alanine ligase